MRLKLAAMLAVFVVFSGRSLPAEAAPTAPVTPAAKSDLLPAPTISSQHKEALTELSLVNLETGNKISISLVASVASLTAVVEWTLYVVDAATEEIKWSKTGKGKPTSAIEWDGLLDDGTYPESGRVYSFKAVVKSGSTFRKTASKDLTVLLVSTDAVEIGEVSQQIGVGICTVTSANLKMPSLPCSSATSHVLLGSIVSLDAHFIKEVKSLEPEPKLDGFPSKGSMTFGQMAASLRYRLAAFDLQLGAAFAYDNISFEQVVEDDEPPAEGEDRRRLTASLQSSAVRLASQYSGKKFLASVEAVIGLSKAASHASFGVTADYVLTPTWFVGAEMHGIRIRPSKEEEPGVTVGAVLLHVGFDIKRAPSA